jgi:hypothetical protein
MEITEVSIATTAAIVALAVELWVVNSALTDRGANLCLSPTSTPQHRMHVPEKPCIAQLLAVDPEGQQRLALYLRGNCPGERNQATIAHRDELARITLLQPWPTCSSVLGS